MAVTVDDGLLGRGARLFSDQWWRLNNLYKCRMKTGEVPVDVEERLKEEGNARMIVPYRPNWCQKAIFWHRWYRNVFLKGRQHGVTLGKVLQWGDECIWNSDTVHGLIADKLDHAYEILGRVKLAYDEMPEDAKALAPKLVKSNSGELQWENGSKFLAGTSMVSSTLTGCHVSEYGVMCQEAPGKAQAVLASLEAVPQHGFVDIESTARGPGGPFHEICMTAWRDAQARKKLAPLDYKFWFFAWWQNPSYTADPHDVTIPDGVQEYCRKLDAVLVARGLPRLTPGQVAWYAQKAKVLKSIMGREYPGTVEEAFAQSIEGAYYEVQMSWLRERGRIGKVPHDPAAPVHTGWDIGVRDSTAIVFWQRIGREAHIIDYYESSGEGLPHYAGILEEKKKAFGYRYGTHVAPHDIRVREWESGMGRIDAAAQRHGIVFTIKPDGASLEDERDQVRAFLHGCWFDEARCSRLIEHLDGYCKAWNSTFLCFHDYAEKNDHIHGADAFRSVAMAGDLHGGGVIDTTAVPLPGGRVARVV